jgi:3-hydroxyacyl-CoA dehydrogenase
MSWPAAAVPARVGVIGGGRMGAGIAQVFLAAGGRVTVVEAGAEAAEAARRRIAEGLEEARRRGKLNEDPESALGRLAMRGSAAELDPRTDLVVEAVPEQPQLKAEVLQVAETAVGPGAVLATNTSSLPVTDLAAADSLEQTLALEARLQAALGQTEDHREAVEAFNAKRKPSFAGHASAVSPSALRHGGT